MRDGVSVVGETERMIAPFSDRYEIAGKMGLTVTLSPEQAGDVGKLLVILARMADHYQALDYYSHQLRRSMWSIGALIGAFALVVALS